MGWTPGQAIEKGEELGAPTVLSTISETDAKARITHAGAEPMTWLAVMGEWVRDYTSPERAALTDVASQRGLGYALMGDYVMAQATAGLVPPPRLPVCSRSGRGLGRSRSRAPSGGRTGDSD